MIEGRLALPELPFHSLPVPITKLGELKSWRLFLRCGKCRNNAVLPIDYLAELYGTSTTVWHAVERLRCRGSRLGKYCGGTPSRVVLAEVYTHGKSMRIARQVVIRAGPPSPW